MARPQQATIQSPNTFVKTIYEEHHTELLLYTRGITNNCLEGEEVLQNFYLKLLKKHQVVFPQYEAVGVRYLKGMVRNLCNDEFKARKKKPTLVSTEENSISIPVDSHAYHPTIIYERYLDELQKYLSELEYQVLVHHVQGYAYREVASQFDLTSNYVGVLLSRTRQKVSMRMAS